MPGKRYEAQDKRVQKMTRDGLMEENLHSGEHKRVSKRTRDASLARDGVEQSQPIRENSQPQVAGGQKWQPRPMAKEDAAVPHANHRPQPVQPDTSQPAVSAVQSEEHLSPGYTQERPTLTSGERYAPPTPARFTQDRFPNEGAVNAGAGIANTKQQGLAQTQRAVRQTEYEASQVQPLTGDDATMTFTTGEYSNAQPLAPQQNVMPDTVPLTEPVTAQGQVAASNFACGRQDTDTDQAQPVGGQEEQAPLEDAQMNQTDVPHSSPGQFSEHSAKMTDFRETSASRAAVQTAAEIRHNRQKKQVQSGYHRYHAENHTADQLQESGADADQGRPPEPVADAAAKAQDTAVDINSVVDIEEGRGAGAAVPTTNQQRPEPGPAAAARAGAPTFSASESTTPPRARAKASSYQSAFRQDDSEPDGRSRSTFDDGTHKNNPKSAREGQQQQKRQRQDKQDSQEKAGTSKKKSSRLSFDDEENGMVRGAGMGIGRKAASAVAGAVAGYVHTKVHSVERENSAVEGAHKAEILGESGIHKVVNRVSQRRKDRKSNRRKDIAAAKKERRLKFTPTESAGVAAATGEKAAQAAAAKNAAREAQGKKSILNRFWQKKRYKEAYAAARNGKTAAGAAAKATQTAGSKAKATIQTFFRKNKGIFIGAGIIALFVLIFGAILSSCTAMMQGTQNTFISSTYPSQDADIYAAENAYLALEEELNEQINNMESTHPGYDEYNYQIDEISHNPYQLISYLTAKYEEFTYAQVAGEVESLFTQQYELIVDEVIEIRTRTVTDPETGEETEEEYEYRILNITLINHGFDSVARGNMDGDQSGRYTLYNTTYGNRNYLFDTATLPTYTGDEGGFGYEIPAEALTDESFARMIAEAEKYLGFPYVWGGSSPSTSFDCSGFVCWVINNCGNGWNVGRTTANGLRSHCAYVSPEEAKPGDLIFFQGTYNTTGASHVGIYVGNGMMIHCGDPVQYTSVQTSYWQSHFLAYGRIQ